MPIDVRFYHLTRSPLDEALARLLTLTLNREKRGLVRIGDTLRLEALDERLWTYEPNSFLPHGTASEPNPEQQPVYLTTGEENPNQAEYLFLVDDAIMTDIGSFEMVALLFDGANSDAVMRARGHWKALKNEGYAPKYYQQNPTGQWQEKGQEKQ